jgi:hypothetical protein
MTGNGSNGNLVCIINGASVATISPTTPQPLQLALSLKKGSDARYTLKAFKNGALAGTVLQSAGVTSVVQPANQTAPSVGSYGLGSGDALGSGLWVGRFHRAVFALDMSATESVEDAVARDYRLFAAQMGL